MSPVSSVAAKGPELQIQGKGGGAAHSILAKASSSDGVTITVECSFAAVTSAPSIAGLPSSKVSTTSADLFFLRQTSKDSSTKLEWKPSPNPFLFGIFDPPNRLEEKKVSLTSISNARKLQIQQILGDDEVFKTTQDPITVSIAGDSVTLHTGVDSLRIADTVSDSTPLTIYSVDSVVLPSELFAKSPSPAPAPEPDSFTHSIHNAPQFASTAVAQTTSKSIIEVHNAWSNILPGLSAAILRRCTSKLTHVVCTGTILASGGTVGASSLYSLDYARLVFDKMSERLTVSVDVLQVWGSVLVDIYPKCARVEDGLLFEVWNPLGIVGVITAFNFPCTVLGWNAWIALVCGSCVVWNGPPGTGKTSTILAVARKLYGTQYYNVILELNASDDRGIDVVRQQIQDFASTQSLSFGIKSSVKLVLLDEVDAMTKNAQFALRRVIEKYTKGTKFALICNHVDKIIPALQSRCTRFRFAPTNVVNKPQNITYKGLIDLVTETDKMSEAAILEVVKNNFEDHLILGEEGGIIGDAASDYLWCIDPLDGTTNFAHGYHLALGIVEACF
ncbi:P-loop containing nucleoside triphosphate hydrolase [Sesbania bispinosa]|nr:P-loop containing nucleoside triphosphate hydrolase [Sesbania bispinosa]